jgi:thymidine kinase
MKAKSVEGWIKVTTGAMGSGKGTVKYSVAASSSETSRTGTMTIAGQIYTVTQTGTSGGCPVVQSSLRKR